MEVGIPVCGKWYVCIVIILPALHLSAGKPEFLTFLFESEIQVELLSIFS